MTAGEYIMTAGDIVSLKRIVVRLGSDPNEELSDIKFSLQLIIQWLDDLSKEVDDGTRH